MSTSLRFAAKAALVALIAVLVAGLGFAQTSNGTIAGAVTDATGAAISNAKVTATSNNTGEVRTTTTNGVGAYRFESVLPGTYSIAVSADGFATFSLANVNVAASVVTSANAMLKIGQANDTVIVEANAETLQTESAEVSHNISTADISKLPVGSLNAYELATTLPGVSTTGTATKFTNGTEFAVNGTRPRGNNFLIEGQDNNDAGIKGQGLQPSNLDSVKEVSVQTNSYAAEFGNAGGSVNNLVYKSGTNTFHGEGWDLLQNSSLNANDHLANRQNLAKSLFRENTFGFNVGGPIKKDKLFFFVSHQWDRFNSTLNSDPTNQIIVPTAAGLTTLKGLLATATPAQAAQINRLLTAYGSFAGQSGITGSSRNIALGNDPLTGLDRGSVEVGPLARSLAENTTAAEFIAKGDYLLTNKDTINLRYVRSASTFPFDLGNFGGQLPGFETTQNGAAHNAGITYTRILTNSLVNELRASYGRIGFLFDTLNTPASQTLGLTNVTISNLTGWGAPTSVPQGRFHNTYQLQDSLSWAKGSHSFKYGFDLADIRVRDTIPFNSFGSVGYANGGGYTGLANFIDDFGAGATTQIAFGSPIVRPRLFQQAYFFQDAWKMRSNLTLTYGLRYEYSGTPANILDFPAIDPQNMNATTILSRVEQQPDRNNFAPRLGLAYTPNFWHSIFGENKTVVRAGFGMFYDGIFTNIIDNTASSSPNVSSPAVTSRINAANPRGVANWSSVLGTLQPAAPRLTDTFDPIANNLRNPEIYQWNFSVERELPSNFTLTTRYVGTRGAHLFANNEANAFEQDGNRRLSDIPGRIILRDNEGDSIYHGLNVDLNRRFTHGLELRTAYTWSKLIDNGSEVFTGSDNYSSFPVAQFPVNRGTFDRGLSAFDRRHRLAFTYIYDLPKLSMASFSDNKLLGIVSNAINGWEVTGTTAFQSGAPGNVEAGFDWNQDGITNDRPFLSNPNAPVTSWAVADPSSPTGFCEGTYWWNVTAANFCHPVQSSSVRWVMGEFGTTTGNYARNGFVTPWTQDWTMAIGKTFKVTERQSVQFKAEMLNPFNHGNTSIPNLTLISGHPWIGSTSQPCDQQTVKTAGCGFADTPTFADASLTSAGNRQIRLKLKYSF
jgi:hypothetical protein